eukprot:2156715-Amphidinium_carterae.2
MEQVVQRRPEFGGNELGLDGRIWGTLDERSQSEGLRRNSHLSVLQRCRWICLSHPVRLPRFCFPETRSKSSTPSGRYPGVCTGLLSGDSIPDPSSNGESNHRGRIL